jgi:hypothetical protein
MPTFPSLQGSLMRRCGLVLVVAATIALPPRLESQEPAAPVLEPLFAIVSDGRWGLINRTGRVVVAPRYDGLVMDASLPAPKAIGDAIQLQGFNPIFDELIAVRLGRKWGFVSRSGELVIPTAFNDVGRFGEERLAPAELNGKWGYINREGRFAIQPQFGYARSIACNLAQVMIARGHKWGLIDLDGTFVVAPEFDEVSDPCYWAVAYLRQSRSPLTLAMYSPEAYDRELIGVLVRNRMGYVNRRGKTVIEPAFVPGLWPDVAFREGLKQARVKRGGKDGYIDRTGRFVIPPQFDDAHDFLGNGLALVQMRGKYGYIDRTGAFVVEPSIESMPLPFYPDSALAPIRMSDKVGYVDRKGKLVIGASFDSAGPFSDGLAVVTKADKSGFIDESGALVIEMKFDAVRAFSDGRAAACLGERWGFIDHGGRFVIEPRFQSVGDFREGLALVTASTEASYIDLDGRVVYSSRLPGLASLHSPR